MKQTSEISFDPGWLDLREPADHSARNIGLLTKAAGLVPNGSAILDLGSGTGSTIRAFDRAGFDNLDWQLLDNDARLLALATARHPNASGTLCDISRVETIDLGGIGLVTASALLDLMSQAWVTVLAQRVVDANRPFYAALNYNGEMSWTPTHQDDDIIVEHFNAHQQRDKGTGPALGPTSGAQTARVFETLGYDVFVAQSPWVVGSDQPALHTQLLNGIADAVAEIDETVALEWGKLRKINVKNSSATVGHLDILALPRAMKQF